MYKYIYINMMESDEMRWVELELALGGWLLEHNVLESALVLLLYHL